MNGDASLEADVNIIVVGWADPKHYIQKDSKLSSETHNIRFNFHINLDGYCWRESHEYYLLASLDAAITANNDEFLHVQFPDLSDSREYNRVVKALQNDIEFNAEGIRLLDRHRVVLQRWTNYLFNRINRLDDDSQQVLKQLFFRSPEKMSKYEKLFGNSKLKKTAHPLDVNFLVTRTGDAPLSTAPFSGHGRPRAASDNEDTPMIQKLASDSESAEEMGLTTSALKAQQRKLSGRKLSSVLGLGDKKTGFLGGSRATRSVDQNRTTMEQERGKEKEKMKRIEKDSLSEISNNTKLLKVAVQRGQETTSNGVLLYEITLKVVGKKHTAPVVYCTQQRFRRFKELYQELHKLAAELARATKEKVRGLLPTAPSSSSSSSSMPQQPLSPEATAPYENFMDLISAVFPTGMKTMLRLSLNDSDLSERTRRLDFWLRDILFNYRSLPPAAKQLVRDFLNFDMSRSLDIFMQDQLAWGLIEAPRGENPVLIVQKSALNLLSSNDLLEQLETMTSDTRSQAASSRNRTPAQPKSKPVYAPTVGSKRSAGY